MRGKGEVGCIKSTLLSAAYHLLHCTVCLLRLSATCPSVGPFTLTPPIQSLSLARLLVPVCDLKERHLT